MAGNLEFIKSENVIDGVTSQNITDIFSDKYDVYAITFSTGSNSTTALDVRARFIDSGGSVISTSNYDYAFLTMRTDTGFSEGRATNQTYFNNILGTTDLSPEGATGIVYVFNPFNSSYTFVTQQSMNIYSSLEVGRKHIGVLTETTSCTGINAFVSASAFGSNTKFNIYGVK
jgi:hypothetical protein